MSRGIYPAAWAAMTAQRAGEKYRPSNGDEGDMFISTHCEHCIVDGDNCEILHATFTHDIADPEYPTEWQYGKDGQPTCTAFRLIDELEVTRERCPFTRDFLEEMP